MIHHLYCHMICKDLIKMSWMHTELAVCDHKKGSLGLTDDPTVRFFIVKHVF